MQLIYPMNPETCKSYVGQRVCAMMWDGTQMFGTISNVTDQGIEFNGVFRGAEVMSKNPAKAKKGLRPIERKGKSKRKPVADTSAYAPAPYGAPYGTPYGAQAPYGTTSPYGYGYPGAYALDWAAIALLFLLPLLFV